MSRLTPEKLNELERLLAEVPQWHWSVHAGVCKHDHPNTSADVVGPAGEFIANCGCGEWALRVAFLLAALRNAAPAMIATSRGAIAAVAHGFEMGIEDALRVVQDEEEGPHGMDYQLGDVEDFRKRCVARLRTLTPQASPSPATPEGRPLRGEEKR